jgi:N-acetylmuramic acid 6-phosphate etherase
LLQCSGLGHGFDQSFFVNGVNELPTRRGHLLTEQANPASKELDGVDLAVAFDIINAQDAGVAAAVAQAKPQICRAIELIAERLGKGGRLIYVGAGTSGRLGVIDAAECPPTFMTAPEMVRAIIAGGPKAMFRSVERAEDDAAAGRRDLAGLSPGPADVVFGISTGGTARYVREALALARERGAGTVFLACVPYDQVPDDAEVSIRVITGPEILAGSTRLKAGTATKMVLNMVSTLVMVRLGKVHRNLMVDLDARACAKLTDRATRTIVELTGLSYERAAELLGRARGRVKTAVVMHHFDCTADQAEMRLRENTGHLGQSIQGDCL